MSRKPYMNLFRKSSSYVSPNLQKNVREKFYKYEEKNFQTCEGGIKINHFIFVSTDFFSFCFTWFNNTAKSYISIEIIFMHLASKLFRPTVRQTCNLKKVHILHIIWRHLWKINSLETNLSSSVLNYSAISM